MRHSRSRYLQTLALGFALLASTNGCVDIFRGAIVQTNWTTLPTSARGEHYSLWASVNEGAVKLAQFKVVDAIDHTADDAERESCGGDPLTTLDVQRVQAWAPDFDAARVCDPKTRVGTIDKIDVQSASLVGGVRWDVSVDLRDAEALFVTRGDDAAPEEVPGEVVARATLGDELDPYETVRDTCLRAYCEATPLDARPTPDPCAGLGVRAPARRGVLLGTWLGVPAESACAARPLGEVAVVPAEDETVF